MIGSGIVQARRGGKNSVYSIAFRTQAALKYVDQLPLIFDNEDAHVVAFPPPPRKPLQNAFLANFSP